MTQMQTFSHSMFGNLEVFIQDGKEYFPATDVAKVLGYSDPHKAVKQHTKDGWAICPVIDSLGRAQEKKFINEPNLYRLIVKSKLHKQNNLKNGCLKKYSQAFENTGLT